VELTLKAFKTQKGKDGLISKAKFIQVMAEHGAADEEFAAAIFESFDRDGNGYPHEHRLPSALHCTAPHHHSFPFPLLNNQDRSSTVVYFC
jgi:hypothetical protein